MFELKSSNGVSESALVGIWLEIIEDYIANVLNIRSTEFLKDLLLLKKFPCLVWEKNFLGRGKPNNHGKQLPLESASKIPLSYLGKTFLGKWERNIHGKQLRLELADAFISIKSFCIIFPHSGAARSLPQ